jgi:SAM-dependent methyltransferase
MTKTQIDQVFRCPCCKSENLKTILKLDNDKKINSFKKYSKKYYQNFLSNFSFEKVILARCVFCLHLFYKYQPSEIFLNEMYSIHQKNKIKKTLSIDTKKNINIRKILSKILRVNKCYSILDYGSGAGQLKEIAEELNLSYYAYEPSEERNLIDKKKKFFSNLNELQNVNIKFDIIFINQVLEHTKDPLFVMKNIKVLCHSKTIIYVSVPNFNRSKEGGKFFSSWPYDVRFNHHTIAPFQHLHCFNTLSLLKLMKNSGFKIKLNFKTVFNFNILILRVFLGLILKKVSTTEIVFELE